VSPGGNAPELVYPGFPGMVLSEGRLSTLIGSSPGEAFEHCRRYAGDMHITRTDEPRAGRR
jgi:hypothetical protein